MKKLLLAGLVVLILISSRSVDAQTQNIEHQPVGCAVAEKYPRLEARFAPADAVAVARVVFQPENAQQWYAVAMKAEGSVFSGVLPKPKKSLKAFKYYIEVTDKALGTNRTADYTTNIVGSSGECKGKLMAAALGSASVLLQVPAGAAALPAGFASTGVVAAGSGSAAAATGAAAGGGGGLGTGAIVGIVAGAGAAAAGAVVVAGKSGGESAPGATSYSGPFSGQYVVTQTIASGGPGGVTNSTCFHTHAFSGTVNVRLEQLNGMSTGEVRASSTETQLGVTGGPNCSSPGPGNSLSFKCALTGTPGNLACSEQNTSTFGNRTSTATHGFSGALSGGVISGMVTHAFTGQSAGVNTIGGPLMTTDLGSTTFSVTLR